MQKIVKATSIVVIQKRARRTTVFWARREGEKLEDGSFHGVTELGFVTE
jgi:hypothetical protein